MAVGSRVGAPPSRGDLAGGEQRSLGRAAFARRAGFSPGGASIQNNDGDMLRYLADVGRGVSPQPRTRGFANVRRR